MTTRDMPFLGPNLKYPPCDLAKKFDTFRRSYDGETALNENTAAETIRFHLYHSPETAADGNIIFRELLRVIADALDHPQAVWRLKLSRSKQGPRETVETQEQRTELMVDVAHFCWNIENDGQLNKAAVSLACDEFGLGRTTVFNYLKGASKHMRDLVALYDSEDKLNDSDWNQQELQERFGPQYRDFLKWLDSYSIADSS